ncbi:MAG: LysE family translocator [Acidimicrobiia bacterium]
MSELAALAAFSFVSAATPGPNNVMLWASGVQFGLRPTLPHVFGTSIGIGTMAVAVAAGLGVLITTFPQLELTLRVIGSLYLLYLAYKIAGISVVQQSNMASPLGLGQATAFQYVNPKAWVFVLAALTAFRPTGLPVVLGSALMALTMMFVVVPAAFLWAAGGTVLNRLISGRQARRILSVILAVLLAATVAYIWI